MLARTFPISCFFTRLAVHLTTKRLTAKVLEAAHFLLPTVTPVLSKQVTTPLQIKNSIKQAATHRWPSWLSLYKTRAICNTFFADCTQISKKPSHRNYRSKIENNPPEKFFSLLGSYSSPENAPCTSWQCQRFLTDLLKLRTAFAKIAFTTKSAYKVSIIYRIFGLTVHTVKTLFDTKTDVSPIHSSKILPSRTDCIKRKNGLKQQTSTEQPLHVNKFILLHFFLGKLCTHICSKVPPFHAVEFKRGAIFID